MNGDAGSVKGKNVNLLFDKFKNLIDSGKVSGNIEILLKLQSRYFNELGRSGKEIN
jgi:hypothetical protein